MLLSIIPNETSVSATAFAVALEFVMVMWVFGVRRPPHKLSSQAYIVACLLCLSHYLFCMVGGDYFTYKDTVENLSKEDKVQINNEQSLYSTIKRKHS